MARLLKSRTIVVTCSLFLMGWLPPARTQASPVVMPDAWVKSSHRAAHQAVAATTLLDLRFEGNANGQSGEVPSTSSGLTYEAGVEGLGVHLGPGDELHYLAAGNIDASSGTVQFWIKPRWNGNDGVDHYALRHDLAGGILIGKDGGNFWRIILNRFGAAGGSELGAGLYINNWVANAWHHAAFTWGPTSIKVYVDGDLAASAVPSGAPPAVGASTFQLGADGTGGYLDAVLDQLVISSGERTAEEIRNDYVSVLTVTALAADPDTLNIYPTWRIAPSLTATTNVGSLSYPPGSASWASSNPAIAVFDVALGKIRALAAGQAVLTATADGASAPIVVQVQAPVLPPQHESVPAYLGTPAEAHVWEVPVVVIRYLPTANGTDLDTSINPDFGGLGPITLANLESRIDEFDLRVKFGLEEGSRYRGSQLPARPSLGYRVVEYITVYEPTPPGKILGTSNGHPIYDADYVSIFERFDLAHFVNDLGVKEVWFWSSSFDAGYPSYDPAIHRPEYFRNSWESNMSSPTTGDISNSNRDPSDLPVYGATYTLYGYNFRRTQAEALHNHGHQVESLWTHAALLQDGNADLFWKKFVGQDALGNFITGRCGWTHMPPNTTTHYDYLNSTPAPSDIADWRPLGGGATELVNVGTWGDLTFAWPDGNSGFWQREETQWYIYWWQSVPGYANVIPMDAEYMTNWWAFVGDWDASMNAGIGLHDSEPTLSVEAPGIGPGLRFGPVLPNPASGRANVTLELPRSGPVQVEVLDLSGRRVRTLHSGALPSGRNTVSWDGRFEGGRPIAGIYWLVATSQGARVSTKVVWLP